jgi:hypothetical protein
MDAQKLAAAQAQMRKRLTAAPKPKPRGNPQNLVGHAWQKGTSGNPSGRSKVSFQLDRIAREVASEIDPQSGLTNWERAVRKQFALAHQGSVRAFDKLGDRILGKPFQSIAIAAHVRSSGIDLTQLTDEKLKELEALLKPLAPWRPTPAAGPPLLIEGQREVLE